jgi:hypothetical protein
MNKKLELIYCIILYSNDIVYLSLFFLLMFLFLIFLESPFRNIKSTRSMSSPPNSRNNKSKSKFIIISK